MTKAFHEKFAAVLQLGTDTGKKVGVNHSRQISAKRITLRAYRKNIHWGQQPLGFACSDFSNAASMIDSEIKALKPQVETLQGINENVPAIILKLESKKQTYLGHDSDLKRIFRGGKNLVIFAGIFCVLKGVSNYTAFFAPQIRQNIYLSVNLFAAESLKLPSNVVSSADNFLRGNLYDALLAFIFTSSSMVISGCSKGPLKNSSIAKHAAFWFLSLSSLELLQKFNLYPGTFDIMDFAMYAVGAVSACFFGKKYIGREKTLHANPPITPKNQETSAGATQNP